MDIKGNPHPTGARCACLSKNIRFDSDAKLSVSYVLNKAILCFQIFNRTQLLVLSVKSSKCLHAFANCWISSVYKRDLSMVRASKHASASSDDKKRWR